MKKFPDSAAYCMALKHDPSLAAIPFQVAAEALDVGRSAIDRQVKAGELEEIQVGHHRLVRAEDVYLKLEQWNSMVRAVEKFLVESARKGETTVYGPVMEIVGLNSATPTHRKTIGKILGEISRKSWAENRFLLSAIVFNKSKGCPSDSFYFLAEELDQDYAGDKIDYDELLSKNLKDIFSYYKE